MPDNPNTVTIKVALSDDDRKLLKSVEAAAKSLLKAAGSGKPAKPSKAAATTEPEDTGDEGDGAEETGDEETGDEGDGAEGDGADAETGDGEDFEGDGADGGEGDGEETGPTAEDVLTAMRGLRDAAGGSQAAMKILKEKGGVDGLSKLKPAKYQAVIDALNKATKAAKAKKAK